MSRSSSDLSPNENHRILARRVAWETVLGNYKESEHEWAAKVGFRCAELWTRDPVLAPVVLRLESDLDRRVDVAMLEAAERIELHLRTLAALVLLALIAWIGHWLLGLFIPWL
jgi:hypothetical protein